MLHIFAMYLLAQFREKRAYRPLVAIFSTRGDIPDRLVGDMVTEGLMQILGSVYDGAPQPLYGLVEDTSVDEYVRTATIDTFLVLWTSEQMPRDDGVANYRSLFHGKLERKGSPAWNGLVSAVADLRAPELLEEVREAFADGLVEPMFAGLKEIERDILGPPRPQRRYDVITDVISEMETWSCFNPERSAMKTPSVPPESAVLATASANDIAPIRRQQVGRNEPCPCGRCARECLECLDSQLPEKRRPSSLLPFRPYRYPTEIAPKSNAMPLGQCHVAVHTHRRVRRAVAPSSHRAGTSMTLAKGHQRGAEPATRDRLRLLLLRGP
jgi:hypothetical protein